MRVWIDQELCTGDGQCADICPGVFFLHDDGDAYLSYVKEPGTTGLDADRRARAADGLRHGRRAARSRTR